MIAFFSETPTQHQEEGGAILDSAPVAMGGVIRIVVIIAITILTVPAVIVSLANLLYSRSLLPPANKEIIISVGGGAGASCRSALSILESLLSGELVSHEGNDEVSVDEGIE